LAQLLQPAFAGSAPQPPLQPNAPLSEPNRPVLHEASCDEQVLHDGAASCFLQVEQVGATGVEHVEQAGFPCGLGVVH